MSADSCSCFFRASCRVFGVMTGILVSLGAFLLHGGGWCVGVVGLVYFGRSRWGLKSRIKGPLLTS